MTPHHAVAAQGWLAQLVGTWSTSVATTDDSEHPGYTATGTETVRAIGDTWIVAESRSEGSDGTASHAVVTLGFDPEAGRFTGSHAGTAAPTLFVYEGHLDAEGALQLDTEGPAMTEGRATDRYRDTWRILDADTREQVSQVLDPSGAWTAFARVRYARVAA